MLPVLGPRVQDEFDDDGDEGQDEEEDAHEEALVTPTHCAVADSFA